MLTVTANSAVSPGFGSTDTFTVNSEHKARSVVVCDNSIDDIIEVDIIGFEALQSKRKRRTQMKGVHNRPSIFFFILQPLMLGDNH